MRLLDHVLRRRAQRVDDHLDRVLERDLDLARALGVDVEPGGLHPHRCGRRRPAAGSRGRRAACLTNARCSVGNHRRQALEADADSPPPCPTYLAGMAKSTPYGLAADVVVDPGELDLELLGVERQRSEHAEAAGLADLDHHVAAVREGEEWKFDAELSQMGVRTSCLSLSGRCRPTVSVYIPASLGARIAQLDSRRVCTGSCRPASGHSCRTAPSASPRVEALVDGPTAASRSPNSATGSARRPRPRWPPGSSRATGPRSGRRTRWSG